MKILGIGNALVDVMIQLESDDFLTQSFLPKGSMQLVDKNTSDKIFDSSAKLKKQITSGGSAANTIHGLARLGIPVGYIGKVGKDELGNFFVNDMKSSGINPHIIYSKKDSGKALALVSPDGERTFATFLGAAIELSADELTPELFEGYSCLHIEGYLLHNYTLIENAIKLAKQNGLTVSLDFSSYNIVEQHKDFLEKLIPDFVDILFANEEESYAYTGLHPEEAVAELGKITEVAIVKIGAKGSLIHKNGSTIKINTMKSKCIDTTGAGDIYASGFLYGYFNNYSLERCGEIASLLAGNVIKNIGAKIPENIWKELLIKVK